MNSFLFITGIQLVYNGRKLKGRENHEIQSFAGDGEAYIRKNRSVSNEELQQLFNISVQTLRRDLKELEDRNVITKVYGGVLAKPEKISAATLLTLGLLGCALTRRLRPGSVKWPCAAGAGRRCDFLRIQAHGHTMILISSAGGHG